MSVNLLRYQIVCLCQPGERVVLFQGLRTSQRLQGVNQSLQSIRLKRYYGLLDHMFTMLTASCFRHTYTGWPPKNGTVDTV